MSISKSGDFEWAILDFADSGGFCVGAAKSCKSLAELIHREAKLIYRETELIYREAEPIYREAEQMLSPDARSTQTESTQTGVEPATPY